MIQKISTAKKSSFVQLIAELQQNYGVEFTSQPEKEIAGQLRALDASRAKTLELIQEHFDEIVAYIDHKKPFIDALEKIMEDIDRQISALRTTSSTLDKGA